RQVLDVAPAQDLLHVRRKRLDRRVELSVPLLAGTRLAGRGHARSQDAHPFAAAVPRWGVEGYFTFAAAFLGGVLPAVVDDPLLRDLAEPAERVAVAQVGVWEGIDRCDRGLLPDVLRLDLLAQDHAQVAVDVRQELRAEVLEVVG